MLSRLKDAALRLHAEEKVIFERKAPIIRLHTPLATGADQLAATSAHAHGYEIRALLPFAPDEYRKDFSEGSEREEFDRLLDEADACYALPGERADGGHAYVLVGKAVVAAADILIAVWDGAEANGPGGTAHVVDLALNTSVPVIHIAIDRASGKVTGIRQLTGGDIGEPRVAALDQADAYHALLRDTLTPHSAQEREQIAAYFAETEKRTNWRIEYPLLLSLLRVKRLPSRPWRQSSIDEDIANDWKDVQRLDPTEARRPLERAYGWANFLAIRYAQLFRSGHITNYALSALAVNLALLGLIVPGAKVIVVILELGAIGLLFYNTSAGTDGEWHRRWLQYRSLAESLRPLIYLKRTGMVSPPFRSDFIRGPLHREAGADWTRWYAAAIWREMDSPRGIRVAAEVQELAAEVLREQILPQADYHKINSKRMRKLDHRLHEIGSFLMGAVIAACTLYIVGYFLVEQWIASATAFFVVVTAGLPAIGAAVFGIRGQGEHLLAASRSANTVAALEANAARLQLCTKLDSLAAELGNTAAIMLAELNDWTTAYRERSLEIPA